ncbi:diguanylate cyclase domain-containing protein [Maridesulfovibrio hydrothermalis]|uniref:Diguanylate cyclase with PAS/PAC sensor n=1 Tax=Maridesulfovibrio hydrothermalis AM13 = DSM 14728 TaxID=1121451 RepID=L0RC76_9BACT|nr:diguanylate cyclase [Maridesulfovibrio hydrothermalis]CCO23822.1 Diguanylate cyclase with PAS/PAC sensor [Maridesulfovibrio hydrothermalis AM13 = DSM 14728]
MQPIRNDNQTLTRWIPLRLLFILFAILFIAGAVGLKLDTLVIKDQEKIYNNQQALQARLAATALDDKLQSIVNTAHTLTQYTLKSFIKGRRTKDSIKKLLKIKQTEINELIFLSFHSTPAKEILTSDITSPLLLKAHKVAIKWTDKYYTTLSGMHTGFIAPHPEIDENSRLAGILAPVWVDDKYAGVLTMIIDLARLTEKYITPLQIGEFGSGFIVDGSGIVIFDQEKEVLGKNIFSLHKDFPELIKLDSRMLHENSGKGEYYFFIKRGGEKIRKLIAWDSVRLGDMKLVIAISATEAAITKAMTSVRTARIAMIGLIGCTLFAALFFFYHYRSKQILISQNNELIRKDQVFEAIAANVPGVIYKCDLNPPYIMHYISSKVHKVTGYDHFEFLRGGKSNYLNLVHPQDRKNLIQTVSDAIEKKISFTLEYRIVRSDGAKRWVYEKGTKLPGEDSIAGFILDITDRKKKEEALHAAEEKYRSIITNAPLGIFQTTPEGIFISANPQMAIYYGYATPEDLIKDISDISTQCYVSADTRKRFTTILNEFGRTSNFEAEHRCKDGSTFWAAETVTAVTDEAGKIIRYEGFMSDISERKEHEETMRKLAMYDSLTGLPNRVLFDDRMKQALSRAQRNRLKIAILYADLDNFKQVNDELGHSAGDTVLSEVAGRFSDCLRTSDTVSRIGGDEFIFILQDIGSKAEIEVVAQRIIDSMRAPFYLGEKIYRLGVSIGISIYPDSSAEKEELVRRADEAMYRTKTKGKNSFSY